MKYKLTAHAQEKMQERGVTDRDIKRVLKHGAREEMPDDRIRITRKLSSEVTFKLSRYGDEMTK